MIEDPNVEWAQAMEKAKNHARTITRTSHSENMEAHARAAMAWVAIAREFREAAGHAVQS